MFPGERYECIPEALNSDVSRVVRYSGHSFTTDGESSGLPISRSDAIAQTNNIERQIISNTRICLAYLGGMYETLGSNLRPTLHAHDTVVSICTRSTSHGIARYVCLSHCAPFIPRFDWYASSIIYKSTVESVTRKQTHYYLYARQQACRLTSRPHHPRMARSSHLFPLCSSSTHVSPDHKFRTPPPRAA